MIIAINPKTVHNSNVKLTGDINEDNKNFFPEVAKAFEAGKLFITDNDKGIYKIDSATSVTQFGEVTEW